MRVVYVVGIGRWRLLVVIDVDRDFQPYWLAGGGQLADLIADEYGALTNPPRTDTRRRGGEEYSCGAAAAQLVALAATRGRAVRKLRSVREPHNRSVGGCHGTRTLAWRFQFVAKVAVSTTRRAG